MIVAQAVTAELSTLLTIAGGITAALAGAVTVLWKAASSHARATEQRLETKLDECEEKHEQANKDLHNFWEKVGELSGKVHIAEQVNNSIQALHADVLATITNQQQPPNGPS